MTQNLTQNIWAVGRNYLAHAQEMKAETPSTPFFFLKSGSCLTTDSKIFLPNWSTDVQHEIEIALRLDENLNFSHMALALDLTARDAQSLAKAKGLPWTLAKSFKGSCPISDWLTLKNIPTLNELSFELIKNKQIVQKGTAQDMIFKPLDLLSFAKIHYPLQPNDIVLTGTPSGVERLKNGDQLLANLYSNKLELLSCHWDVI